MTADRVIGLPAAWHLCKQPCNVSDGRHYKILGFVYVSFNSQMLLLLAPIWV